MVCRSLREKPMTLAIRGEISPYLLLIDPVAGKLVAMLAVRRRWVSRDPLSHETLSFRRERESEVRIDLAHCAERVRVKPSMIDVVEALGTRSAHLLDVFNRTLPIGTFARPEHVGARRIPLEHAPRHVQGATQ